MSASRHFHKASMLSQRVVAKLARRGAYTFRWAAYKPHYFELLPTHSSQKLPHFSHYRQLHSITFIFSLGLIIVRRSSSASTREIRWCKLAFVISKSTFSTRSDFAFTKTPGTTPPPNFLYAYLAFDAYQYSLPPSLPMPAMPWMQITDFALITWLLMAIAMI